MYQALVHQGRPRRLGQPDGELICILCGTVAGQTYGRWVAHHAGCARTLPWQGGRPRCCACGGALICEPVQDGWGDGLAALRGNQSSA